MKTLTQYLGTESFTVTLSNKVWNGLRKRWLSSNDSCYMCENFECNGTPCCPAKKVEDNLNTLHNIRHVTCGSTLCVLVCGQDSTCCHLDDSVCFYRRINWLYRFTNLTTRRACGRVSTWD